MMVVTRTRDPPIFVDEEDSAKREHGLRCGIDSLRLFLGECIAAGIEDSTVSPSLLASLKRTKTGSNL